MRRWVSASDQNVGARSRPSTRSSSFSPSPFIVRRLARRSCAELGRVDRLAELGRANSLPGFHVSCFCGLFNVAGAARYAEAGEWRG
jgi:hypothetical protein